MINRPILFIAASLLAASQAPAADSRIKTIAYDADEIVRIVGHSGIQSTIQFGIDERIENVAVGDSSAWQVTPNRRGTLLFVKPLTSVSRTNMTVVTDKRTYMFDLQSGAKAGLPLYSMKFVYADVPATVTPIEQIPVVMAAAPAGETGPASLDRLNFGWRVKGSDKLRPARIFDDGKSLFLAWAPDVQLPAILTATDKGAEAPLDYRIAGEYIVLTPVPQNIVLRFGKNAATAWPTSRPGESSPARIAVPAQPPVQVEPDNRLAIRSIYASRIPETQKAPAARGNTIKTPGSADLLSDNLTDGRHDH